ncbi:MAG: MBL fold metallo-hydrolase [Ruminococcaceae bacterium]|nr:MBL fold metallo-hydrolase [Oscillospiraceae bacterium]
MLNIHTLPLGDYQTNCYLLFGEGSTSCAIIDPGYAKELVLDRVRKLGLSVEAILLTHGHFDHVGAVEDIVRATGCKLWMSKKDWSQSPNPTMAFFYPLANCDFTEVCFCEEGEIIQAGGLRFEVLATPGHTCGSVCYCCEDALFSGDTLFAGSCGRTDLPGGDWGTIQASLKRLSELPGDYRVFPGHGEETTLSRERQCNPYLR